MLRITTENNSEGAAIKLEGKVAGAWVGELERTWYAVARIHSPKVILVDLCDVTFIDDEGKKLLRWMCGEGASFKTRGCVATSVVQQIKHECEHWRQLS